MNEVRFTSLKEFYPYYLTEHQNFTCRILHFIGTLLLLLSLFTGILFHDARFIIAMPFIGYTFAWVGHFFFEKNKPATFKYPLFSLASDFLLFWDLLNGKESFKVNKNL